MAAITRTSGCNRCKAPTANRDQEGREGVLEAEGGIADRVFPG